MSTADHTPSTAPAHSATASPEASTGGPPDGASPQRRRPGLNTDTLALAGVFIAMFAFLASVFAVGLAARAVDEHRAVARTLDSGGTTNASSVSVSLTEFRITPDPLTITAGTSALTVTNDGTVIHNLSVDGAATPMLDAGASAQLDIGGLDPGTYTLRCDVAGHEAAGMTATISVE